MSERKPIEILLDAVEWKAMPHVSEDYDGVPYATHEGTLHIGGATFHVYQLSNGQRVIDEHSMIAWLAAAAAQS